MRLVFCAAYHAAVNAKRPFIRIAYERRMQRKGMLLSTQHAGKVARQESCEFRAYNLALGISLDYQLSGQMPGSSANPHLGGMRLILLADGTQRFFSSPDPSPLPSEEQSSYR